MPVDVIERDSVIQMADGWRELSGHERAGTDKAMADHAEGVVVQSFGSVQEIFGEAQTFRCLTPSNVEREPAEQDREDLGRLTDPPTKLERPGVNPFGFWRGVAHVTYHRAGQCDL